MLNSKNNFPKIFKVLASYTLSIINILIFLIISIGIIAEIIGYSDKNLILGKYGSIIASQFYYLFGLSGIIFSVYILKKSLDFLKAKENKKLFKNIFLILIITISCGGLIFIFREFFAVFNNYRIIGFIPFKLSDFLIKNIAGSVGTTLFYILISTFSINQLNNKLLEIISKKLINLISKLKFVFNKTEDQSTSKNEENEIKINLEKEPEKQKPIVENRVEQIAESNIVKSEKRKKKFTNFQLPSLSLLDEPEKPKVPYNKEMALNKARSIEEKLVNFGIEGKITEIKPGPVITMYEYKPAAGTKINKIASLSNDLAMALKATRVRIIAPIPGKDVVGIEVPNDIRETVYLKELLSKDKFKKDLSPIFLSLGKDIGGSPMFMDLKKAPHLMIAGTTGSGKSVFLHSIITSMLYKGTPQDLRFIMIDPKMLELSGYEDIPHLLHPVVTDPKKSAAALKWAVKEMEMRYKLLSDIGVRDIDSYNSKVQSNNDFDATSDLLPYIVIIIDELADLMFVAPNEIKESITRLSQMARAAGIHLIVASQRPSADVVAGLIKANFPARISFAVSSKTDSRIILDASGAEELLGKGDMLLLQPPNNLIRIQGSIISDKERENISNHLKNESPPEYNSEITKVEEESIEGEELNYEKDALYDQALEIVKQTKQASISMVQRRLKIGYNRAANIIEMMEKEGIVGEQESAGKPRKVNI
ncbi:MAG: DNA translocase FtsK 4TM domain-containing protein [Thermodesulfobacteriota bacterium]|nr:DNA translocase FtsK 4TM domain-containing protein [Candidatus Dadabacteria bacterium]|tara:strand:- start:28586 stop:30706 length:2121 start_codon:yes stop_codon:yes gene_type:complete